MNDTPQAWQETGKKLKAEAQKSQELEKQNEKAALITLDKLRGNPNIGLKNMTAEDVKPPTLLLVQGDMDKSQLLDNEGQECPNGKLFLKGFNEVLDELEAYFVYIKADIYRNQESEIWDNSKMYGTIAVRKEDMQEFSMTFRKSSNYALSDLLTTKIAQKLPIFVFLTEIKVAERINKKGQKYFVTAVNVKGIEEDPQVLTRLNELAKKYDSLGANLYDEVDEVRQMDKEIDQRNADSGFTEAEDVSDDITF
jgi:hypothetical protein